MSILEESLKEAKKDLMFWEGFDEAIILITGVINEHQRLGDFGDLNDIGCDLKNAIDEEIELYKKDGLRQPGRSR